MNKTYTYPGIEEWYQEPKAAAAPPLQVLINEILKYPRERSGVDEKPEYLKDQEAIKNLPAYHYKTGCYDNPELIVALTERGLTYATLEMGAMRWIVLTAAGETEKKPLIMVFHAEDYFDAFWNEKTLDLYSSYIDELAAKRDRVLIFMVANCGKGATGTVGMYSGQITEAIQNYGADKERIYIDLTDALAQGMKLNEIAGFRYPLEDGTLADDAESYIEDFDGLQVINFSKRWVTPWRRHGLNGAQDGTLDSDWQIHSEFGRKMLDAMHFNERFASCKDPEVLKYWDDMGLIYGSHYFNDERWVIFSPKEPKAEKLPCVVVITEVNEPDDHGPIAGFATFYDHCLTAAQGDCVVIFFAMESPEKNDWIADIVKEAAEMYPIDLTRVYMTGHSHNGHFTQEFARRNPKVLAAIAPLGNSPGLPDPSVSHEAVAVDDERAAIMETMDMPTVVICGCCEVGGMVPINQTAHAFEAGINVEGYAASAEGKIAMWNRRLKAERIPLQSTEDIMAAAGSSKKAERMLGFPADRSEIIYIDGFEHYVGDLKNVDGNYHFRVIAVENTPHRVTPSINICAWNYMKKFARDQETGAVIELE